MLKVLFELQTDNEKKKQFNGYVIWHNITNEASTAWKMKELFKALGTGLKSGIDFDEQGIVTRIGSAVPGKTELLVKGKYGTYQGQAKLEVDTLSPLPNRQTEEYAGDMDEEATSYEEMFEPAPQEDSFAGEEWDSPADDDLGGEPPF
jgi:hypothetical protein